MNTFCALFGARLREERERKGLSQAEFGALGGVGKLAQLNYEKGQRSPSVEYLHGIVRHGIDIDYLLFGERAPILEDRGFLAIQASLLMGKGLPTPVDAGLLAEAIASIDAAVVAAGIDVSPTRRARGAANLYMAFSQATDQERSALKNAAAVVVSEWVHLGGS